MKAYLLAAGLGTRLSPLTDSTPKCLLPIAGEPLLGRWLRACNRNGIGEVLVNTHYLPEKVRSYIEGPGRAYHVDVTIFYEESLLGSAGTVLAAREFAEKEESFFIIYSDNVSEVDLGQMIARHNEGGTIMTMGLFKPTNPEQCGIAVLNGEDRVVEFIEKPVQPRSAWGNAGLYVARPSLFDWMERISLQKGRKHEVLDFGHDIISPLAAHGEVLGYQIEEFLVDIGTPRGYAEAQNHFLVVPPTTGSSKNTKAKAVGGRESGYG